MYKRFSDAKVVGVPNAHEASAQVDEICRRYAISSATGAVTPMRASLGRGRCALRWLAQSFYTGMPVDRGAEGLRTWREGIRALAERPNVTVKLSGLGMLDWFWTTASIRPFVREAVEAFGVDRAMFASNFPVDRLYSSFDRLYDAFREVVADLPAPERRALFRDTALRVYRL